MIIKTVNDEYINLNQAQSWSFRRSHELGQVTLVYEFASGDAHGAAVYLPERERFENSVERTLSVPAEPGYFRLGFSPKNDKGEENIDRWPVLAWQLDLENGFHEVITLWSCPGEDKDDDNWAVLCPDKRVISPGTQHWKNEADWLEDRRKEDARKRNPANVTPIKRG